MMPEPLQHNVTPSVWIKKMSGFLSMSVATIGLICGGLFWPTVASSETVPTDRPSAGDELESPLYKTFDPGQRVLEYQDAFESVRGFGMRNGIEITPPRETFKDFRIEGRISEPSREELLRSLEAEMLALAKRSKVTVLGNVQHDLLVRPIYLLSMVSGFGPVDLGALSGFYFEYHHDGIQGACDVMMVRRNRDKPDDWILSVFLHEAPGVGD